MFTPRHERNPFVPSNRSIRYLKPLIKPDETVEVREETQEAISLFGDALFNPGQNEQLYQSLANVHKVLGKQDAESKSLRRALLEESLKTLGISSLPVSDTILSFVYFKENGSPLITFIYDSNESFWRPIFSRIFGERIIKLQQQIYQLICFGMSSTFSSSDQMDANQLQMSVSSTEAGGDGVSLLTRVGDDQEMDETYFIGSTATADSLGQTASTDSNADPEVEVLSSLSPEISGGKVPVQSSGQSNRISPKSLKKTSTAVVKQHNKSSKGRSSKHGKVLKVCLPGFERKASVIIKRLAIEGIERYNVVTDFVTKGAETVGQKEWTEPQEHKAGDIEVLDSVEGSGKKATRGRKPKIRKS